MQFVSVGHTSRFNLVRKAVLPDFGGHLARRPLAIKARMSRDVAWAAQVALTQEIIAQAFNIPVGELRAATRRKARVALARQIAMYLVHVAFGLNLSEVGLHFGRDRTTAAHACRQMEDRRYDQDFDMLLDRLERAVRAMPVTERMQ